MQNTLHGSLEMFTFDQTLVVLESETVTLLLVQKCFLCRVWLRSTDSIFAQHAVLELELHDCALQDLCRSAQTGHFLRDEFKPQHAIHSFSIQHCRKAQPDSRRSRKKTRMNIEADKTVF
jgi:hypothetical protein